MTKTYLMFIIKLFMIHIILLTYNIYYLEFMTVMCDNMGLPFWSPRCEDAANNKGRMLND